MQWEIFLQGLDEARSQIRQQPKKEHVRPGDPILNGLENLIHDAEETYQEPVESSKVFEAAEEKPITKLTRLPRDNKPAGSPTEGE